MFYKGALPDCIRVRGLHLAFGKILHAPMRLENVGKKEVPGSSPQVGIIIKRPNTEMLEVDLVKKA